MRKPYPLLLTILFLALAITGCSKSPEDELPGRWYKTDGSGEIHFFADGTVVIKEHQKKQVSGDYKILDEGNLRFDLSGLGALAGTMVLSYELEDERLLLDKSSFSRQEPDPSVLTISAQVAEGLNLSGGAKAAVAEFYMDRNSLPPSNLEAGLMDADEINGKYVGSVAVNNGTITATFGGPNSAAHDAIGGKAVILTPAAENGFVSWSCSSPSIEPKYLPKVCR